MMATLSRPTPIGNPRGNRLLRLADGTLGVVLLRLASLGGKRTLPTRFAKIGLLKTSSIGDTLLLAGAIEDLVGRFPDAELVLITGRDNAAAGALLARKGLRQITISVSNVPAALRHIRALKLDLLFDFGQWPRIDALLATLSGACFRVGFRTAGQHRHYGYDAVVDHSNAIHEWENYSRLIAAAGVHSRTAPALSNRKWLAASIALPAGPFIVFHPWPGGIQSHLKEWPEQNWRSLAQRLGGRTCVVTGGSEDQARSEALANGIRANGGKADNVAGRISFAELPSLLLSSQAVVSVNTGVMHLAALLGVPTVALNGPTNPARWGPIGPRVRSVTPAGGGCGYLNLGFEYEGHPTDCMERISVDQALDAVNALTAGSPA